MKGHFIVIGVFVAIGLIAAYAVIPRDRELALMHLKDKEFELAMEAFQRQLDDGDWSVNVVVPLTKLYLQYGRVNDAAEMMETFVKKNPKNVEARRMLGTYLQYAQRPDDYVQNLKEMSQLELSEYTLRELAAIQNFNAEFEKQIETLTLLVKNFPHNPKDFLSLASLQASLDRYDDALVTLRALDDRHKGAMDEDVVELYVSLLLDAREAELAFERAEAYLGDEAAPELVARFASLFGFKGQSKLALELIKPFDKEADEHPGLLAEFVRLQVEHGERGQAYDRLNRLYKEDKLPLSTANVFLSLILDRQDQLFALEVAGTFELVGLADWVLAVLAETAVAENRIDFVRNMIEELGPNFLSNRPILAAEVTLAAGDEPGARNWVEQAEAASSLSIKEKIDIARVYLKLNEGAKAAVKLKQVAFEPKAPDSVFTDLVHIYLTFEDPSEGLDIFGELRKKDDREVIENGWVILAAKAGRTKFARNWLYDRKDKLLSRQVLSDLYYIAAARADDLLALTAAQRILRLGSGEDHKRRLLQTVMRATEAGRALATARSAALGALDEEEVQHLADAIARRGHTILARRFLKWFKSRDELDADEGERSKVDQHILAGEYLAAMGLLLREMDDSEGSQVAYVTASALALDFDEPLGRALARRWAQSLAQNRVRGDAADAAVKAIVSLRSYDLALPYLQPRARERGGDWFFTYVDAAVESGEFESLNAFLKSEIERDDLEVKELEGRLHAILKHGDPTIALSFVRDFAIRFGGNWFYTYVETLEAENQLETLAAFLEDEIYRSDLSRKDRELRLYTLIEHVGPEAAIVPLRLFAEDFGDDWFHTYIETAAKLGRDDEVIEFLEDEIYRDDLPDKTRQQRLYTLLERAGPEVAMPYLEEFALLYKGDWIFAYVAEMEKLGRTEDALDFLVAQSELTDADDELRRFTGFKLLEAGHKTEAEVIFLDLANGAKADSPDVGQLLFLWGPRPHPEELAWIARRAAAADGEQRAKWLDKLLAVNASRRVLDLSQGVEHSDVKVARLTALIRLKRKRSAKRLLLSMIAEENDSKRLRWLADRAFEEGFYQSSAVAYERLLEQRKEDAKLLQRLAHVNFFLGDHRKAERYFRRYLPHAEKDPDSHFFYGELLVAKGAPGMAVRHYRNALDQMPRKLEEAFNKRLMRATLLLRTGRKRDAVQLLEVLLKEQPKNDDVRAVLISALIETGAVGKAQSILDSIEGISLGG